MLYRVVHFVNTWYGMAVVWAYVLAFLVGFSFLFIFPQITLLLLFLGLASLAVVLLGAKALTALEGSLRRRMLAAGVCPECQHKLQPATMDQAIMRCVSCGAEFSGTGARPT
jgi:DNA-directed RNA polymerase subunit RPC12/RpoP